LQVFQCEQVISYLKKFVAEAETKVEAKAVAEAPEPGMKLLKKKDADDESMFSGLGSKKGKGARKAAEKEKVVDKKTQVGFSCMLCFDGGNTCGSCCC
jgi:hypothetical protein